MEAFETEKIWESYCRHSRNTLHWIFPVGTCSKGEPILLIKPLFPPLPWLRSQNCFGMNV